MTIKNSTDPKLMKILFFSFLFACIIFISESNAQEAYNNFALNNNDASENMKSNLPSFQFNAYSWNSELEKITPELSGEHLFGNKVAKKLYLFEKKYTSEEAIAPGNPATKTVIKKPIIFEAVKQIEKHLKKAVKKGEMSNELAATDFNKVLDVALNILTADTRNFESTLKSLKDNSTKIELFTKRVTLVF